MRKILRFLALLTTALAAACSSTLVGQPSPDTGLPQLPARPRELRIDGLDPCGTLTADQVKLLGVVFHRKIAPGLKRGPGCDWNHSPNEPVERYTVDVNTAGGVELAFGQPDLHVITVASFGAVETPSLFSLGEYDCVINVDVAPGQAVQISYFYTGANELPSHPVACEKARRAAEMAMQTILARS